MNTEHRLRPADVRRHFDRAAAAFDGADFVHRASCDGLLARLEPLVIEAQTIVDLGCATGSATRALARRFKAARVLAVDVSRPMLEQCREKQGWFSKTRVLQANATALPFADQSVDVVFSNMLLPWLDDPAPLAAEISRILRKDGLFLFSSLGPDSLLELRNAWRAVDEYEHVNRFVDMHDLGDALVRAGLSDPVLDVDRLNITYADTDSLFRDLTAAGGRNALQGRNPGLLGKGHFAAMCEGLESAREGDKIHLDLELVYGHCWGSGQRPGGSDIRINPGSISVRGR